MKSIKIHEIVTDAGTQIRASISQDTVENYAEAMKRGDKFPPLVVFHDSTTYILADGFHRILAAGRIGRDKVECDVRKGTKSDALKFSLGANTTHGLPRTNADKRLSVSLALAEWPKLSDRSIAKICAVSNHFVGECRPKPPTVNGSQLEPETRVGADGKTRKIPKRKAKPEPTPDTETPRVQTADEEMKPESVDQAEGAIEQPEAPITTPAAAEPAPAPAPDAEQPRVTYALRSFGIWLSQFAESDRRRVAKEVHNWLADKLSSDVAF